jgi:hypothetical protein
MNRVLRLELPEALCYLWPRDQNVHTFRRSDGDSRRHRPQQLHDN